MDLLKAPDTNDPESTEQIRGRKPILVNFFALHINDLMVFGTVVGLVGLGDLPVGHGLWSHN